MATQDPTKWRASNQRHFEKNKDYYREKAKRRRQELVAWWEEYKANLECVRCGEKHPACLDFHHRDPTTKEISIAVAVRSWSKKRLLEEIAKCDVLCSNCHRKHHWEERQQAALAA